MDWERSTGDVPQHRDSNEEMGVSRRRGYRWQGKGYQGWIPDTGVPEEDNAKDIKEKLQN